MNPLVLVMLILVAVFFVYPAVVLLWWKWIEYLDRVLK